MEFIEKSNWQSWIWHLFTSHWVAYLAWSFTNIGNDLRINLTLLVTSCSGERSFSKLKMVEWKRCTVRQNELISLIL